MMSNQKRANRQAVETPSVTPAAETPSEVLETPAAETVTPAAETVTPAAETVSTFKVEGLRAEYNGTLPLSLGASVGASWESHRDAWVAVFLAVLNHATADKMERQLSSQKLKTVPDTTKSLLKSLYKPAEVTPPTVTIAKRQPAGETIPAVGPAFQPYLAYTVATGTVIPVRVAAENKGRDGTLSSLRVIELESNAVGSPVAMMVNSAGVSEPAVIGSLNPDELFNDPVAYVANRQRDAGAVFNPLATVPTMGTKVRVFDRYGNGPASGVMREGTCGPATLTGFVARVTFTDAVKSGDTHREYTVADVAEGGILFAVPANPSPMFSRMWETHVTLARAVGDSLSDGEWATLVGATRDAFATVKVHASILPMFSEPATRDA